MRQIFWGFVCGVIFWYGYERLDPASILDYLNSATESAVKSTSGYGGTHQRK